MFDFPCGAVTRYYDTNLQVIDINQQFATTPTSRQGKSGQNRVGSGRHAFWAFCQRAAARSRMVKGAARGVLTAHDLDKLLVDQQWRCAVSGIAFEPPGSGVTGLTEPFAPSLDRIKAGGKYEIGNVRLVCNIVNFAMNRWGENALHRLVREMRT